jgi:hypothetical protein
MKEAGRLHAGNSKEGERVLAEIIKDIDHYFTQHERRWTLFTGGFENANV